MSAKLEQFKIHANLFERNICRKRNIYR